MPGAPDRAVAIVNPATRGNYKRIIELLELAAPRTTDFQVYLTEHAGHASALAQEHARKADVLIAVGGDGTVADVAAAVRGTPAALGIIPGGSTNIVARGMGIPTNAHSAARLVFEDHEVRAIDAGVGGDRTFLHMAGAGLDSNLFALARPELKRKVGWMAYLPAAIEALRRPMATYSVRSEEMTLENVRSPLVLVANGSSVIAPQLQLDSRIKYDDGLLDVLFVTATTPIEMANVLARIAMRQMGGSPHVVSFTTRDVTIEATPDIPVQFDGDVVGTTPVRLKVDPRSVQIIVPQPKGK